MQATAKDSSSVSSQQPSSGCSQISLRAWVDDILTWIPTCDASFAPLIEQGYTSPVEPTFNLTISSLPANVQTRASARLAASGASGASQRALFTLPSDSDDHFVVSPEYLANVDRQLMEAILKTIEH
eukprot:867642-Pleurochrysis_carterae.AAC.1